MMNDNNYELSEKEQYLINHLKSIATADDTEDELFAVTLLAEKFDEDGDEDEYLDKVIAYIKKNKNASVKDIRNYLESLQPPIEIVDNEEESA